MIKIRIGAFETNSSSTHCIILCSEEEYQALQDGDMLIDRYAESVISRDEINPDDDEGIETYEEFKNGDLEFFEYERVIHGEKVHVIGCAGFDG